MAHIEHWLSIRDKAAKAAYIQSDAVRESLVEAVGRTIFRPDYSCPRSPYYAADVFAMAFALSGMRPRARAAFDLTDGVVTGYWNHLKRDPVFAYNFWRDISRV